MINGHYSIHRIVPMLVDLCRWLSRRFWKRRACADSKDCTTSCRLMRRWYSGPTIFWKLAFDSYQKLAVDSVPQQCQLSYRRFETLSQSGQPQSSCLTDHEIMPHCETHYPLHWWAQQYRQYRASWVYWKSKVYFCLEHLSIFAVLDHLRLSQNKVPLICLKTFPHSEVFQTG